MLPARARQMRLPAYSGAETAVGGYKSAMDMLDENLVRDTVCGLELQLIDAVERQERAEVQDDADEAARIQGEIDRLQSQLASVAEAVAVADCG